jgi:hypothetical protein
MMRELRLYDPARTPKTWTDIIRPGQYAVFHSDVRTDVEKKPDGHFLAPEEESFCLVFDSLAEAEAYCAAKVDEIPSLRCDIYDHLGKGKPPTLTYVNYAQLHAAKKTARWGWALIAASVPCFLLDWHWSFVAIVPTIVGLNLVFAGLRLIYWGTGGKEKRRSKRATSS